MIAAVLGDSEGVKHTSVKLVMAYELLPTKTGEDLAAYFLPANATMNPPLLIWKAKK